MIQYLPYEERTADTQFRDGLRKIYHQGVTQPASRQGPPSRVNPFGQVMEFRAENGFPFETLRPLKGAFTKFVGEALWILSGDTSLEMLHKYGVQYWDSWCQDFQCDRHGLKHGDFGGTYGHQFRNFGGTFNSDLKEFVPNGVDQLKYIVDGLSSNPHWRRWLITPFNPAEYDLVEIVPCHGELFFLAANGDLYLHLVQRSGDWPVGVPSNMVMWAFGGMLIAELTGLRYRGMTHFVSNAHYYGDPELDDNARHEGDQTLGVRILMEREPNPFPAVQFEPVMLEVGRLLYEGVADPLSRSDINPENLPYAEFIERNVVLTDYNPLPGIAREKLPVSV